MPLLSSLFPITKEELSATYGRQGANVARFIQRARSGEDLSIACLGDSILEGTTVTNPATEGTMHLLAADLSARFGITVTQSNHAVSGYTALRSWADGKVAAALAAKADLYIVSAFDKNDISADKTGVNGLYVPGYPLSASIAAIERMVRAIRDEVPQADIILLATNPYVIGNTSNPYQRAKDEEVRSLAAVYGCEFVDAYQAFLDFGNYDPLVPDGTHPNTAGHRLIADTVLAHIPNQARTPIPASAPGVGGLHGPEKVGSTSWGSGSHGLVVSLVTGSNIANTLTWVNTGTWTGTGGSNPYLTTTPGDYAEFTIKGTELHLLMSTATADAPVLDVTVDGSLVADNQSFTLGKSGFYYVPIAVGLSPSTTHTIRLTLVSGKLSIQRAAALSSVNRSFKPATEIVVFGSSGVSTGAPSDGTYLDLVNTTLTLPTGWNEAIVQFVGYTGCRVNGSTTTNRHFQTALAIDGTNADDGLQWITPPTSGLASTDIRNPIQVGHLRRLSGSANVRLRTRLLSTDKTLCFVTGWSLQATLIRTA